MNKPTTIKKLGELLHYLFNCLLTALIILNLLNAYNIIPTPFTKLKYAIIAALILGFTSSYLTRKDN
jgi:hypothetical protein